MSVVPIIGQKGSFLNGSGEMDEGNGTREDGKNKGLVYSIAVIGTWQNRS
jgi:hypothetical protein